MLADAAKAELAAACIGTNADFAGNTECYRQLALDVTRSDARAMATKKKVPKPKAARKVLHPLSKPRAVPGRQSQVDERALSFDEALRVARPGMRLLLDFGRGPFYYTIEGRVQPEGRRALLDRLLEMEFERPAWAPQRPKTIG